MRRIFILLFVLIISTSFIGCSSGDQLLIKNSSENNNIEKSSNLNKPIKKHMQIDKKDNKKGK